jgi:hypothetical protein
MIVALFQVKRERERERGRERERERFGDPPINPSLAHFLNSLLQKLSSVLKGGVVVVVVVVVLSGV